MSIKSNLNYFFSLLLVGSALALGWIVPAVRRLFLVPGGDMGAYSMVDYLTPVIVLVLLPLIWKIRGSICPVPANSRASSLLRVGQIALGVANSAVLLSLFASVLGYLIVDGFGLLVGFIIAAALMFAVPLNLFGIICVEISRLLNTGNRATSGQ